jgi:hypothetical protein
MPPKGLMRSHRLFLILLGSWIAVFCGLKTLQHFSFGTNACDLSIVDYGFSSTLKGEVMADPFHQYAFGRWDRSPGTLAYVPGRVKGWESHFAVHFTPILFLFIPFYIVFPGPLVLLYIEVLAVGLSAMFLFLIARDVFKDKLLPVIVAVIYLFFRQVLIGVMHDFHTESLFPVLVLGGYYFLAIREKHLPAFLFFSLALLVREDIGIYLFFLGIFVMFKLKKRNPGLLLSAAGLGRVLCLWRHVWSRKRELIPARGPYHQPSRPPFPGRRSGGLSQGLCFRNPFPASVSSSFVFVRTSAHPARGRYAPQQNSSDVHIRDPLWNDSPAVSFSGFHLWLKECPGCLVCPGPG